MLPDQPGPDSLRRLPNSALASTVSRLLASRAINSAMFSYRTLVALAGLSLLTAGTPLAIAHGQDAAQQTARQALKQGRYVPLENIVRDALKRHPGKLLEVELDDGIYEVEILRADGVVIELDYDARSGALLKTELDD